ncbi:peptidoglycan DD-metalloendopeptidase family protein [Neobacillus sp. NRS-1170]|uniref:peptidoglycan DD-metalloendopeptidase family protein n=1 Tax=Neobacillus sp. NRS-1170 TaxID=3233898 RepID=UPI003D2C8E8B
MDMARSSADEIRRRIARRKKEQGTQGTQGKSPERHIAWPGDDDDKYGFNQFTSSGSNGDDGHPLFKKEVFFFKILASILLFLVVAILFRNQTASLEPARDAIVKTMDKDFKFATVSKWYEDKFGKPLALLPFIEDDKADKKEVVQNKSAVEVSGRLLENFKKNGQGIMIETQKGAGVQAINDGFVRFTGVKDGLGNTVIIQHSDGSETWYGNLDTIKVNLYDFVEKRTVVGSVSSSTGEDKSKGKYYFAIKKGDDFIDPIQVIRFE